MIADLKPYAEYKDSGLSWLGPVPGHWGIRRMKTLLREVDSRSTNGKEQLLRVSQYTGVTQRESAAGTDAPDTRAASLVGYKQVAVNDLVINIMLAWNGSMGVSRYSGIASPAYCVYRFRSGALPWYYHQLLRLPIYKGRIKTASTGVVESRLRLYSDDLGCIEAILPPPMEQEASCALSGLGEWAAGARDPGQAQDHRAAQRAEASHHPPRRHPRPRPPCQTQGLRHPLARPDSGALVAQTI